MRFLPKDGVLRSASERRKSLRPVPGYRGVYVAIALPPCVWSFDATKLHLDHYINVLTGGHPDWPTVLKPWRHKKHGVEYGALWVGITDNRGKRHHYKLEQIAEKAFGADWPEIKRKIDLHEQLQSLF